MGNKKAVIINNDRKSVGKLEAILASNNYDSIFVHDAFLAVDVVVQSKPDVIFLELMMRQKNGFKLIDEINRALETKRIPLIAMSVFSKDQFGFLLNLYGVKSYLKKPLQSLDVIWAIENTIESHPLSVRKHRLLVGAG